ncbi:zymogen granule membrane protein 16-like [Coregonus clupeaformis]|uniref:zymogen granule membrane protein 16-like n=1 Tax=Coregonus clupeaformis TaxID=59861 RepID=UPI001E1C7DEF|nr:zymogen granule membrane protein 16-like [Coregonus clupeaformis]
MFSILFVTVFLASCLAMPIKEPYSYSSAVGLGTGTPFASSGEGRITAVRVWENNNYYYYYYYNNNAYINGFQLRYSNTWSPVFGREVGEKQEMELFKDEAIVEVSGKYNPADYICYLVITTNTGRTLTAGLPNQVSFNFYPANKGNELRLLSGRFNGAGITSIGAHWGLVYKEEAGNSTSS